MRAGADAYGKICFHVPLMLGALQDVLIDGLAKPPIPCTTRGRDCVR